MSDVRKRKQPEKLEQEDVRRTPARRTKTKRQQEKEAEEEDKKKKNKAADLERVSMDENQKEMEIFQTTLSNILRTYGSTVTLDDRKRLLEDLKSQVVSEYSTVQKEIIRQQYKLSEDFLRLVCLEAHCRTFTRPDPSNTPIFYVRPTDKIGDVWKGLIDHNILAAPILVEIGDLKTYSGFIDMMDIVNFVLKSFDSQSQAFMELKSGPLWDTASFGFKTVTDVVTVPLNTLRNYFSPIRANYSAYSVLEPLAREPNLHRIAVVDEYEPWRLVNIITHSQLLKFLSENLDKLGPKANKPIGECVYSRLIQCVLKDNLAIDGFRHMLDKSVTAVPFVDDDGSLLDVLSIRDLKVIGPDTAFFWRLGLKIPEFIDYLKKEFQRKHHRPRKPVTLIKSDTLGQAISRLVLFRIHRIFIVDEKNIPIGVVSIKDILTELLEGPRAPRIVQNVSQMPPVEPKLEIQPQVETTKPEASVSGDSSKIETKPAESVQPIEQPKETPQALSSEG